MSKKKKKFDDWMPSKPAFVGAQKYSEEQAEARERYKKQKEYNIKARKHANTRARLKKDDQ